MKILVVSGAIGSGKSEVCRMLEKRGVPVYDCDSGAKALYETHPDLAAMVTPDIFCRPDALAALENALYPVLIADIMQWAGEQGKDLVAVESAIMLQKPQFDGFGDYVLWVKAGRELRIGRAAARPGMTPGKVMQRDSLQKDFSLAERVTKVIDNSSSMEELEKQIDNFLKEIGYGNREN